MCNIVKTFQKYFLFQNISNDNIIRYLYVLSNDLYFGMNNIIRDLYENL